MARLFDDAATEYLELGQAVLTDEPISQLAWINLDALPDDAAIISLNRGVGGHRFFDLRIASADSTVRAAAQALAGQSQASSTAAIGLGAWHHICAVFAADNDRRAYLDGGNKGTEATARAVDNIAFTNIGRNRQRGDYVSGIVAEAVILRIAVTDYQVWLHAQGVPAPIVWPGWAIAAYCPLFEVDRDFPVGRYNMTPFNTPSWAPHPPKVLAWWRKYMRGGTV